MAKVRCTPANTIDRVAFRDMCKKFANKEIAPRWEKADREKKFPMELYIAAAAAGLIGITADESLGGGGLGAYEEAIAMEEMSYVNPNLAAAVMVQNIAGSILWEYGNDEQNKLAKNIISGKCLHALAVTEPEAGSDVQNIKTTAVKDGDYWIIDGLKSFITLAGEADVLVTLVRTDKAKGRKGFQFFAIDRNTPGIETSQISTYVNRPAPTYRVMFNEVRVPESRRVNAGFDEVMAGFNRERINVSARWLGHMQHVLEWAKEYALVRHQFGRPIAANQSIAFQLAQCYVDVEATRHLTYYAAQRWDSGVPIKDLILDVSSAKLFATQAVWRVSQIALHIGGGWGVTEELPVMKMAIDALVAPITVGSWEIQLRAIARTWGLPTD